MEYNAYRITNDGFGIHTFELTIPYLSKMEFNNIIQRLQNNRIYCKVYQEASNYCLYYPGIKIYLNHPKKRQYYARVVVTPNSVINAQASSLSILNEQADISILANKLNETFHMTFDGLYDLNSFSLSRIDCCVNVMLSKEFSAERYIKLIGRSVKCSPESIKEFEETDEAGKARNKHSFRVKTKFGHFTAYDKYFQLENIHVDYEAESDALLRLELAFNRSHINQSLNDPGLSLNNNTDVLQYYLKNSKKYFFEFVNQRFYIGRYYTVAEMKQIIANSNYRKSEKKHMLTHIDKFQGFLRQFVHCSFPPFKFFFIRKHCFLYVLCMFSGL